MTKKHKDTQSDRLKKGLIGKIKDTRIRSFYTLIIVSIAITFTSCSNQKLPLHNKRVMILGNSITQNGAYVDVMEYYLRKAYPNETLDIISIGLSSETANGASEPGHPWPRPCIHSRLDDALSEIKPDLVLSCYGMNDGLFSNPEDTLFESYKTGIMQLKDKVEAFGAEIILMTPTTFDSIPSKHKLSYDGEAHSYQKPYHNYNKVLNRFANWLLTLDDVKVIDWHHYLDAIQVKNQASNPDTTFVPDGVHPNLAGHFLMAKKVLMELYPEISIPEPYPTLHQLKKDELFKRVSKRRQYRSNGWRNYIGYTREKVVKSDNIEEVKSTVLEFDEQIEALLNITK